MNSEYFNNYQALLTFSSGNFEESGASETEI